MSPGAPALRPGLETLAPYEPGKPIEEVQREYGLARVIKLASNENPLGPSPRVLRALRAAQKQVHFYPDGSCHRLRQAVAGRLRCRPGNLVFGNGSNELLVLLGLAFLRPGDEVLTSDSSFVVYYTVPKLMDARLVTVPLREYAYDLEAMAAAISAKTRIVFIANPNNPTGTAVRPRDLERFLARVPPGCLVVLDEAYQEYLDAGFRTPSLGWVRDGGNVVVLRTFSKAYGLAGLRVGYGIAPREVAQAVERVRPPFNVGSLAQAAALAAWSDAAYVRRSVALARRERRWLERALARRGYAPVPSQANFVFLPLPSGTARSLFTRLLRLGVIIRPAGEASVRITVGTRPQNARLLQALEKISPARRARPD